MKKIRGWNLLMIMLSVFLLLSACTGKDSTATPGDENDDEFEEASLKFGHHLDEDHILHKQAEKFAELVSEKTNGKVDVTIYSNGQLGDQKELIDGIQMGSVDMTIIDTAVLANFFKPLSVLDLPYIFNDLDHAVDALDGDLGDQLASDVKDETGLKVLTLEPTSFRSTALTEKAVNSPDDFSLKDFSGHKIRVLDSPVMVGTFESFGTKPATIPTGEAYTSMQTNVVEGMESNPEFLKSININEVAKYMVDTKHMLVNQAVLIDDDKFNGLPANTQKAIEESMDEATQWFNDRTEEADQDARDTLEENGVEILEVDLSEFEDAVSSYNEKYIKENDLEDYEQLIQEAEGE